MSCCVLISYEDIKQFCEVSLSSSLTFHYKILMKSMKVEEIGFSSVHQSSKIQLNGRESTQEELAFDPIDELQLMADPDNPKDREELNMILRGILNYPSGQLAEIHSDAMKLGSHDLEEESKMAHDETATKIQAKVAQVCGCCGFKRQEQNIKMCTSFDEISNIGTSTYLFFVTFKNLSILLIIITAVFSIYSLATNIIAAKNNAQGNNYTVDYLTISLSSKEVNNTSMNRLFFFIQAWLGAVTVFIWVIIFFVNRYREFKQAEEYDADTISASDYSIVMTGIPLDVTLQEIQKSFEAYYLKITSERDIPDFRKRPLKVMKINIGRPFYMSEDELKDKELEDIEEQLEDRKETLRQWIKERQSQKNFSVEKAKRDGHYKRLAELIRLQNEKYIQLKDKLIKKLKENDDNSDELTSIFVTFQTNIARNFVLHFNQLNVFERIKVIFGNSNKYIFQRDNIQYSPSIQRAPQPQDIIWTNIGRSSCNTLMRKIFTYFVTAVLLGLCFMIVYFLSVAQQNSGNDRILSIAISVVIAVVNIILGVVINLLTIIEKDYTSTNRQASLAVKSIFAQMINSILIPVITAYYIKTSTGVYQTGGLVDNIFMMSITNSVVPPLVLFVNPAYLVAKFIRFIKTRTGSKLYQTQKEHNILHEGIEFQVGFEYIFIVNLFMFVCFFVSLQPIISVIALIGYILMYWAQKFTLFYRYKRPVPGTDFVNKTVYQLICIGPLIYSLGSLTWSNFDPNGIPPEAIIPNLVAVAFSVLLIMLPMNPIIESCCFDDDRVIKVTKYEDDRIFFPSEYDRANPSTSLEGIEDYKRFMEKKNIQMSKKSKQEQELFNQKKIVQLQRGILNQVRQVDLFGANILNINNNAMQANSMNIAFDLANQAVPMNRMLNPNMVNPFAVNPYSNTLIPAAPLGFGISGNINPNW